jgi:hypothetical protein
MEISRPTASGETEYKWKTAVDKGLLCTSMSYVYCYVV